MSTTIIKYPLDLTGRNPSNKIVGEPHDVAASGNRVFVPNHGPFYSRTVVLRRRSTGEVLTMGLHYKPVQLFAHATQRTGQNVCALILITPEVTFTDIEMDVQVLGGEYSASVAGIESMIATLQLDDRPVRYGQLLGKPVQFDPAPHRHDLGDVYGFEYVVTGLEGIRQAILMGDVVRDQEIYDYIDRQDALLSARVSGLSTDFTAHANDFGNPHRVDKGQVGLPLVENFPIATLTQAQNGSSNLAYMTPLRSKQLLDTHATNYNNPHNVDKGQIGLSNVANYPVCTLPQALEGTSTTTYTTPYHVKAMIQKAFDDAIPPEPPTTPPTARFVYSGATTVDAGQNHTLTFANQSILGTNPIATWLWEFGDGTTSAAQSPPAKTYTAPGASYQVTVKLTATDDQGFSHSQTQVITLNRNAAPLVPPTANFTHAGTYNTVSPTDPSVTYTNASTNGTGAISSWLWEFGDGTTSTLQNPPAKSYAIAAGSSPTMSVKLTVTDVNGLSSSVTKAVAISKAIPNSPPVASLTYNPAQLTVTAPTNHQITFTPTATAGSNPIVEWKYEFGDGQQVIVNTAAAQSHVYSVPVGSTTVTVKLTVKDSAGLTHFRTYNLNLVKNPEPQLPPDANFNTSGSLNVVEGSNHVISVADASTNGSAAIVSWQWDWGDGTGSTGRTPPPKTYSVPVGTTNRTITLTVVDGNGLSDTFQRTLALTKTAAVAPTAQFVTGGTTTVVEGNNHSISVTDQSTAGTYAIASWHWNWGDGTTSTGQAPGPHAYNTPVGTTNYTITLTTTDTQGRTSQFQRVVTLTKTAFTLALPSNLDFEQGDIKWTRTGTMAIESGGAYGGAWKGILRYTAGAQSGAAVAHGGRPISPGQLAGVSAFIRPSGAGDNVGGSVRLIFMDYWGTPIKSTDVSAIVEVAFWNGTWKEAGVQAAAPTGTSYYTVQLEGFSFHAGATVEFDNVSLDYVPPSGGGGGGGGGGPGCVAIDMYMDAERQASDIAVDDWVDGSTYDPDGIVPRQVRANAQMMQPCYRMVTESGIALVASDSTPMTMQDGSMKMLPEMLGELVLVDDRGDIRWERVVRLPYVGMRRVVLFNVDDQSYFAGEVGDRRIATHNAGTGKVLQ